MAETETLVFRDRDETETLTIFVETRRWYVSRPSRDRDVETETTTLSIADPRCTLMYQILSRSIYYVALWRRKTPIFAIFWTSAFSVVANWQQSDKVEHGCTTTNLPLPNGIKIVSVLQRLHGEIGRTNTDVQKRDGQTNRQTKKTQRFGRPGGG